MSTVTTTRPRAEKYVDGTIANSDNRTVLVIRLLGHFSVLNTGPPGAKPYSTGTVMTVVADAHTGAVLDFGLDTKATPMPAQTATIFHR